MELLYKYTGIDYLESCIERGIYASNLSAVNDPYEGLGIEYPNRYRICCLTKHPLKMLLWSYYVNHRGCRVGYDISGIQDLLHPVDYVDWLSPHEEQNDEELMESLLQKGREWEHEGEVRAVYFQPCADERWERDDGADDAAVFLHASVREVAFGCLAHLEPHYKDALRLLRSHNLENPSNEILVRKCKLRRNAFGLYHDGQFDLSEELKRFDC